MGNKKTLKKTKDATNRDKDYNEGYSKGFDTGDWVVSMLSGGPTAFVIPANPYEANTADHEMCGFNGWRDGFHHAIMTYCTEEDVTFHDIFIEYVGRFRRSMT